MLTTLTRVTHGQVESKELTQTLATLSASGWVPAISESKQRFSDLAGLAENVPIEINRGPAYSRRASRAFEGDIFFHDSDVYYLITRSRGSVGLYSDQVLLGYPDVVLENETDASPEVEIGLITTNPEDAEIRLNQFSTDVENAIRATLDGRKTRHMKFEWEERSYFRSDRLERVINTAEEQSNVSFGQAELVDEELVAANLLVATEVRETLIELSRAVFAREKDVFGRGRSSESKREVIDSLVDAGLVNKEYLLECRRTGSPLTRLQEPAQLSDTAVGQLTCPACNSRFEEENLSEGYSVSSLGRKMAASSHWMTVWVTDQLRKVGIPSRNVWWNLAESGEEVDMLAHFLGHLWLFELKDREFGAGDAYPLNYRQARYRPNEVFVVTTEKVSRDAKRVFEEALRESRRDGNQPTYVEGLDAAEDQFRKKVDIASVRYATQRLEILAVVSGYDLGAVLTQRVGQPYEVLEQESDDFEDIPF